MLKATVLHFKTLLSIISAQTHRYSLCSGLLSCETTYLDAIESKQFHGRTSDLMDVIPSVFSEETSNNIHQVPKHQGDLNVQNSCTKSKLKGK